MPKGLGRGEGRQTNLYFFLDFSFIELQRRETLGPETAFDSVLVERRFDFAKIDCDLAFFAGKADAGNDVADGVGIAFLRQLGVKFFQTDRKPAINTNHFLVR